MGGDWEVRLSRESYRSVLNDASVAAAVHAEAQSLAAAANRLCESPEEGELYIAVRSDGTRTGRAASAVLPSNARTMAHENKHHSLMKALLGGGR